MKLKTVISSFAVVKILIILCVLFFQIWKFYAKQCFVTCVCTCTWPGGINFVVVIDIQYCIHGALQDAFDLGGGPISCNMMHACSVQSCS